MTEELYSLHKLKEYLLVLTDGSVAGFDCLWFIRPATLECRITHLSVGPVASHTSEIGLAPTGRITSLDDEHQIIRLDMSLDELMRGGPYGRAIAAMKARPAYNSDELEGCVVSARGQESGTVVNFIVDVGHWDLLFFEVDIGDKEVLVEPAWTSDIDLTTRRIRFDLPATAIAEAPAYRPSTAVDHRYCEAVYKHYASHQHLH